jgi:hypothetical protein
MAARALRVIALSVSGALAIAALALVIADHAGTSSRTALLGGYVTCDSGPADARIGQAPLFAVDAHADGSYAVRETVDVTVRAGAKCYFGAPQTRDAHLTIGGVAASMPDGAPAPVPADGHAHEVVFAWKGQGDAINRAGVASTVADFDVLSQFPLASDPGTDPDSGHYLGSPGPELNVTVPAGSSIDATSVSDVRVGLPTPTVYAGRTAVFGVATGGSESFEYSVRYTSPVLQAFVAAAPFVLAVTATILALAAGGAWLRRRRARAEP